MSDDRLTVQRSITRFSHAILGVCLASVVVLFPAAAHAATLPKGAYWYSLYDIQNAWKVSEGAGVTVAVLDSGVQASLGDLRGNVLPGIDLTGQDPGGNSDDPVSESYGHGSDMATKIAGTGKGAGLVGIAPQAKILPVDVGGSTGVDDTVVHDAIVKAVNGGAKIINMSFGASGACDEDQAAGVKYAYQHDVIVVASAGDSPGPVDSPANCPGVIAVGGVDAALKSWTETPSGPEVAFVAPAYNLVNEQLNGLLSGPSPGNNGTSSAAAFTSGVFALLRSHFPKETARQIVTRALYNLSNGLSAGHLGQRANDKYGYGMILPKFALTDNPPANAKNPIYDQFARELGPATPVGATTPAGSSSTGPGSSPASSTPGTSASKDGSSSNTAAWATVIISVLVIVLAIVFFIVRRSRRPSHSGPGGPGGPHYPPPPPGY